MSLLFRLRQLTKVLYNPILVFYTDEIHKLTYKIIELTLNETVNEM